MNTDKSKAIVFGEGLLYKVLVDGRALEDALEYVLDESDTDRAEYNRKDNT